MKTFKTLTYVSNSLIHGKGLFARTNIPEGTIIGQLEGRPSQKDGRYVLWLSETEAFKVDCQLKYINHAISANACYYDDLTVVALNNIKQDEEITHNYETADW